MIISEGQILQNRYYIDSLIGQGGMSYVYRAVDKKLGRTVAVKVLKSEYCDDEEFIRKFQNEAQAAAKLNHPNIVAAYDVVDEGKLHFIIMEMVEGITLKNYIQRKGRLDNKEAVGIALQVLDGMEQAHCMGIVHRDIKPQNMIVGEDGIVKVADFGIARAATQQTVNATVMGSVHYISPEQARSGISDERSDIYSFGCTLFEMLTGKLPFEGENSVSVVLAHLETLTPHVRDIVPEVYPALDEIVWRCMQKKPDRRYQTVEELADDLRQSLTDPEGHFLDFVEEEDTLGETRILSANEIEQIKRKSRTRADRLLEDIFVSESMEPSEVNERMGRIYRMIAIGCVAIIIVLAMMIGGKLLGFMNVGSRKSTTGETEQGIAVTVSETDPINITISALDSKLQDIIGMDIQEAETYLADYNVKFKTAAEEFSDRYADGTIVSYPSGSYAVGDTIEVTVSKGTETLDFSDQKALQEMSFEELKVKLDEREIPVETEMAYSDTVPAGNIIASNKMSTAGSDQLRLTVSKGAQTQVTSMPALENLSEQKALEALEAAGLQGGTMTYQASESVPEGSVISQQYVAGSVLSKGTTVDLVISRASAALQSTTGNTSYAAEPGEKWYSNINESCVVGQGGPGASGTILVSIRLRQYVDNVYRYTELQKPRSYAVGTEIQVVFGNIEGAPGVETGVVEVVDASTDTIIQSFGCKFGP